ncbi:MAG: hypothetical protein RLZZ21_502 [Planctomycetota bacterium]|jgi:hypothetical protein
MARQEDHRKCAEWQQRLRRFEKSGLTVARFCARERVAVPTFWYWRRKRVRPVTAPKTVAATFAPVEVIGGRTVTVRFPAGAVLELPEDRPDLVRTAVAALAGAPQPC